MVDANCANPQAPYNTWATAHCNLMDASAWAVQNNVFTVIVRVGTYKADSSSFHYPVTDNHPRSRTFIFSSNPLVQTQVSSVHGGFVNETNPDAPDGSFEDTILTGDVTGADPDRHYHVVSIFEHNDDFVLDGFKITGGWAHFIPGMGPPNVFYDYNGAGLFIDDSTVFLENLIVEGNWADETGGGMLAFRSNVNLGQFIRCETSEFEDNHASRGSAMSVLGAPVTLSHVHLHHNGSHEFGPQPYSLAGGGVLLDGFVGLKHTGFPTQLVASNCVLHDNRADIGSASWTDHVTEEFTLVDASPCIDAGSDPLMGNDFDDIDKDTVIAFPMPLDFAMTPREKEHPNPDTGWECSDGGCPGMDNGPGIVDMGAYEAPPPAVPPGL